MDDFLKKFAAVLDHGEPMRPDSQNIRPVPAGVIVPVVVNAGSPVKSEVLFTLRTQTVKDHKGQVSFPGGAFEPEDANILETALRETLEETGIEPQSIEIAGALHTYDTITNFRIYPFVGLLSRRPELKINEVEIEKAFYVPMDFLCHESNIGEYEIIWEGSALRAPAYRWDDMVIWGATFNMLVDLKKRINKINF